MRGGTRLRPCALWTRLLALCCTGAGACDRYMLEGARARGPALDAPFAACRSVAAAPRRSSFSSPSCPPSLCACTSLAVSPACQTDAAGLVQRLRGGGIEGGAGGDGSSGGRRFNFAPASALDDFLYVADAPGRGVGGELVREPVVAEWIEYMKQQGVTRVLYVMDHDELARYRVRVLFIYLCAHGHAYREARCGYGLVMVAQSVHVLVPSMHDPRCFRPSRGATLFVVHTQHT